MSSFSKKNEIVVCENFICYYEKNKFHENANSMEIPWHYLKSFLMFKIPFHMCVCEWECVCVREYVVSLFYPL
jgi:hypothetical protein